MGVIGRALGLMAVMASGGCADDDLDLSPPGVSGAATVPEGAVFAGSGDSGGGGSGGTTGLAPGAECTNACDCATGYGCFDGSCITGAERVFCCTDFSCPLGQLCDEPGGGISRCAAVLGGQCLSACDCPPLVACIAGYCSQTEGFAYCCTDPFCPDGFACDDPSGVPGTCFVDFPSGI